MTLTENEAIALREAVLAAAKLAHEATRDLGRASGPTERLARDILVREALDKHGWVTMTNHEVGKFRRRGGENAGWAITQVIGWPAANHLIEAVGLENVVRRLTARYESERERRRKIAHEAIVKNRSFNQAVIRKALQAAGQIK